MDRLTKRQANTHSTIVNQIDLFDQNNSGIREKMGKNQWEELPKHISIAKDDNEELYEFIGNV